VTDVVGAWAARRAAGGNINVVNGWGGWGRQPELAVDYELGLGNDKYTPAYMAACSQMRADSIGRMRQMYSLEDLKHKKSSNPGQDPGNFFEIKCPTNQTSTIVDKFGENDDRRMVQLDARTFKFGEFLTRACT